MSLNSEIYGLIFKPDKSKFWMQSHASVPTVLRISHNICRIFFSSRDERQRSHIGYFDIDLDHPDQIIRVSDDPVLEPGPMGYFDDHGVYASSVVKISNNLIYMYTIGWNPGVVQPLFYSSIGLAISKDGGDSFQKYGSAPIMARSEYDPCLVTAPYVMLDEETWRMWYVSGYLWTLNPDDKPQSHYNVKYAESEDGINWHREGLTCIANESAEETNISRTTISKEDSGYRAWFSSNAGQGYKINTALSLDGLHWSRENIRFPKSTETFDNLAQAYPCSISYQGRNYIFYNGNEFGKDGVGLTILSNN